MKIGILSDTHNDINTLQVILNHYRREGIKTVLHCGDLTSPENVKRFHGFTLHLAFGNGDYLTAEMQEQVILLGTDSSAKRINTITIGGSRILITHGNMVQDLEEMKKNPNLDVICTGHTHSRENSSVGKIRIINPGAASRVGNPPFSYAIYDLENNYLEFHQAKS